MMTILATGAYGRKATKEDWLKGLVFRMQAGGPYFSIRDSKALRSEGCYSILFCDAITREILFSVNL